MGRPKVESDRVRLNTTIAPETKEYLLSNGERHQGKAIDALLAEVRSLKKLVAEIQGRFADR